MRKPCATLGNVDFVAGFPFARTPVVPTAAAFLLIFSIILVSGSDAVSAPLFQSSRALSSGGGSGRDLLTNNDDLITNTGALLTKGGDGCHFYVASRWDENLIGITGVLFTVSSSDNDDDGLNITSLGLHVDVDAAGSPYEVWSMNEEGLFCDNCTLPGSRGQFDKWQLASSGIIRPTDLVADSGTGGDNTQDLDFYEIPFADFTPVSVPPNGGNRSFYVTFTDSAGVIETADEEVGTALVIHQNLATLNFGNNPLAPFVRFGQGYAGYPFSTIPQLYENRRFIGKVYYNYECPTVSPSFSPNPSFAPSISPTAAPSWSPTASDFPTMDPTVAPSLVPSFTPSQKPTFFSEFIEAGMEFKLLYNSPCPVDEDGLIGALSNFEIEAVEEALVVTAKSRLEENDIYELVAIAQGRTECKSQTGPDNRSLEDEATAASSRTDQFQDNTLLDEGEEYEASLQNHEGSRRKLPTASSSYEVSLVITGEYRPPTRSGYTVPTVSDFGNLAEESINADPVAFKQILQSKTIKKYKDADIIPPPRVETLVKVGNRAVTIDAEGKATTVPVGPPSSFVLPDEDEPIDGIIISIVILAAIIVLCIVFLLYRHLERKTIRERTKKIEEARTRRAETDWELTNLERQLQHPTEVNTRKRDDRGKRKKKGKAVIA